MAYKIPILVTIFPVILAALIYQLDTFEPAPYPEVDVAPEKPLFVPKTNSRILDGLEKIGAGQLQGPEDISYDPIAGIIYTGTTDGWINRVTVNEPVAESKVERWVNTGGRPLGLAHGHHGEVIVADSAKGLLNVSKDGTIELLTDEAEGLKFKLTDFVALSLDGILYFTDASYKYKGSEFYLEILEGKPYGRFMSYDPSTEQTKVLLRDLYFANGVVVSPDHNSAIVCETLIRRCQRYYIKGEKKGLAETFIENLPGLPDNIRYDGEGKYWIAMFMGNTPFLTFIKRYPFVRKVIAILNKYVGGPRVVSKNAGAFVVDLDGKPVAHYYDPELHETTCGIKIGEHLYIGSTSPYIMRVNLTKYPAI